MTFANGDIIPEAVCVRDKATVANSLLLSMQCDAKVMGFLRYDEPRECINDAIFQIFCLSEAQTCHCGEIVCCESLCAVRQRRHVAVWPVVDRYADHFCTCLIRPTQWIIRQLLCGHPRRSGIWLLNSVLRFLPISTLVVELAIQCELIYEACRVCAGSRAHMAIFFGLRLLGPLRSAIGQQGDLIVFYHRSLPRGPGRQCRAPHEFADFELSDDIRVGQEIITHISCIPDPPVAIS